MAQDKESTFCCAKCGNIHVQIRAWVDVNTFRFVSDCEDYEGWCDECDEHVRICTVAEFERNNPDVSLS